MLTTISEWRSKYDYKLTKWFLNKVTIDPYLENGFIHPQEHTTYLPQIHFNIYLILSSHLRPGHAKDLDPPGYPTIGNF